MKKTFTQEEFYNHGGCWRKERNKDLRKLIIELSDSNGNISFESLLLSSLPSLQDKVWWMMNSLNLSLIENRYLALESAKSVANIYNKKYPNDKRISLCINMTARYLKGLVSLDILIKYKKDAYYAAVAAYNTAADVADAAVYAANIAATAYADDADASAADTANTAASAAYAAASAVDIAYNATCAAADAAANTIKQSDKLIKSWIKILKTFKDDNI